MGMMTPTVAALDAIAVGPEVESPEVDSYIASNGKDSMEELTNVAEVDVVARTLFHATDQALCTLEELQTESSDYETFDLTLDSAPTDSIELGIVSTAPHSLIELVDGVAHATDTRVLDTVVETIASKESLSQALHEPMAPLCPPISASVAGTLTASTEGKLPSAWPRFEQREVPSPSRDSVQKPPSDHERRVSALGAKLDEAFSLLSDQANEEFRASERLTGYIRSLPEQQAADYIQKISPTLMDLSTIDMAHILQSEEVRNLLKL